MDKRGSASLSMMVKVAVTGAIGRTPAGLLRASSTVSLPSFRVSLVMGTVKVRMVVPAVKIRLPVVVI